MKLAWGQGSVADLRVHIFCFSCLSLKLSFDSSSPVTMARDQLHPWDVVSSAATSPWPWLCLSSCPHAQQHHLCKWDTLMQGILQQVPLFYRNRDLKRYHHNVQAHPLWHFVKSLQLLPLLPLLCFWYLTKSTESTVLVVRTGCRAPVLAQAAELGLLVAGGQQCPPELPPAPRGAGTVLARCHCPLQMGWSGWTKVVWKFVICNFHHWVLH